MQKAGKLEEFCFRQSALPIASGVAFHGQHTSARGPLGEDFSASKGPMRKSTVPLWTPALPAPVIAREHTPLYWGALPRLTTPSLGAQTPTYSRRAAFKRLDGLRIRRQGFESQFWQTWKSPITSLNLSTLSRQKSEYIICDHQTVRTKACVSKSSTSHKGQAPWQVGEPERQGNGQCVQGNDSPEGPLILGQKGK